MKQFLSTAFFFFYKQKALPSSIFSEVVVVSILFCFFFKLQFVNWFLHFFFVEMLTTHFDFLLALLSNQSNNLLLLIVPIQCYCNADNRVEKFFLNKNLISSLFVCVFIFEISTNYN